MSIPGHSKGTTMLSKKLLGVAFLTTAALSSSAFAGDRDFNTVAGAVVGAAIGNSAGGRDGAIVGGLVGAAVGNSIRTDDRHYRGGGRGYVETRVYSQPAPVYYERPAPVYYERPAPVYYERPAQVYYSPPPRVVYVEPHSYYRDSRWERDRHHDRHDRHDRWGR
jgi:hypothetical protein